MAIQDSNGEWKQTEEDILTIGMSFSKDLFKATAQSSIEVKRHLIQQAGILKLNEQHLDILKKPFTLLEIPWS